MSETNAIPTPSEKGMITAQDVMDIAKAFAKGGTGAAPAATTAPSAGVKPRRNTMTETVFHQKGTAFFVQPRGNPPKPLETLPAGNYVIKFNPMAGYYLEMISDFPPIRRVYGDANANADRILRTYQVKNGNLGVLLDGIKGSGKTLTARLISMKAATKGIPTLVINSPYGGEDFFQFLYSIQQECVVLFDEFEKVYTDKEQEALLTVLDGTFPSKKLFLLTSNDKSKINQHLKNRPGRIHYYLNFKGLSGEFIREYVDDVLENKDHAPELLAICGMFAALNFDSLHSLVWEMNLYNEPAGKAIAMLNTRPEEARDVFDPEITIKGIPYVFKGTAVTQESIVGNPLSMVINGCCPRIPVSIVAATRLLGLPEERVRKLNEEGFEKSEDLIKEAAKEKEAGGSGRVIWDDHPFYAGWITAQGTSYAAMTVTGDEVGSFLFGPKDLKEIKVEDKSFLFVNQAGNSLKLTRRMAQERDVSDYARLVM